MKLKFSLLIVVGLLVSCGQSSNKNQAENASEKLKKEAIELAKDYAKNQLKEANVSVAQNGMILISDDEKKYLIDPSEIFTGFIDNDSTEDVIVSFTSFYMQELGFSEQLIFINLNGQLTLMKSIEDDIKVIMLKDRIITAELHTKPRNSPLYNCESCIETVDYRFENGELVKLE